MKGGIFLAILAAALYAIDAPFIGVFLSLLIFRELPGSLFIAALILMIIGAWLSSADKPLHKRRKRNRRLQQI